MTDPKELLAVLDMPKNSWEREKAECQLLVDFNLAAITAPIEIVGVGKRRGLVQIIDSTSTALPTYQYDDKRLLADLAFRLRDEASAKGIDFQKALNYVRITINAGYEGTDNGAFWGFHIAQPIHWIIAALIAKEKK